MTRAGRVSEDHGMTTDDAGPAGMLETKYLAIPRESLGADGAIEGYASLFDVADDSLDEVARGAFAASLARPDRSVKLLWQHDPAQPIGVWDSVRETERGLYASGRLLTELRAGAEAAALLRAGAIDGLSIGYRAVKSSRLPSGGRRLVEVDLWEISLVTFPMLPAARATAGPAADDGATRRLAASLRAAGRIFA
jgi:HK97 family phage prohead protease